jgi:hypothetical protein
MQQFLELICCISSASDVMTISHLTANFICDKRVNKMKRNDKKKGGTTYLLHPKAL